MHIAALAARGHDLALIVYLYLLLLLFFSGYLKPVAHALAARQHYRRRARHNRCVEDLVV